MKHLKSCLIGLLAFVSLAAGPASATSTINPNVPAQNSALSSAALRAQFLAAYNDINTIENQLVPYSSSAAGLAPAYGSNPSNYVLSVGGWVAPSGGGASSTPVTTVATSGSTQNIAFPANGNAAYDITLTANCTVTLTGGTAGQLQHVTLLLRQNSTAGWTPTLPTGVKWPGGVAPTPNTLAGKFDVFTFETTDAGTTVIGGY